VNLYGLSYHFERDEAKASGFDNEVNAGLGLRYRVPGQDFDWIIDAGAFRDSRRNTAVLAGGGVLWKATERLRLGAALGIAQSDTYNDGAPFIAPLPLVVYEWRAATLNLAYFPRVPGINDFSTVFFWLTLWPRGF
jgi:antimicrobial peptide resistance and lipid A acylation protein PagP